MAESPLPRTCLSSDEHRDRVLEVTLHYSGCLSFVERQEFYDTLPENSKRRISRESRRIARLRTEYESRPGSDNGTSLRRFSDSLSLWRRYSEAQAPSSNSPNTRFGYAGRDVDEEVQANLIYFRDGRSYDIKDAESTFPNQKVSVKRLLTDDASTNLLMEPNQDGMVRYFHFPANNMSWVEEAIARYYHEARPSFDPFGKSMSHSRSKTQMLLRSEFWRGQQQGGDNSEVHARHMRPICNTISVDPSSSGEGSQNLVCFMPYLHWETDRGRVISAQTMKKVGKLNLSTVGEVAEKATAAEHSSRIPPPPSENDMQSIVPPSTSQCTTKQVSVHVAARRSALGKLLFFAAVLSEAMSSDLDERLINEYLHSKPPLHPRRTLDQSFYGVLKNTETRDRDQVVYRATTPLPHTCIRHLTIKCGQCNGDVRKVPRLVMVDQLWLWVLDEKTIITCFPKRWGRNKPDPSAVHKSLRMRLKSIRQDEIQSAYDLALVIIDQCSRVFFDRTKTVDRQPKMVDIFAEAIREVTYKQTASFDQFRIYTHLASKENDSREIFKSTALQNTLLNINTEGRLLKEIKDILDELHILTRINLLQQAVVESFAKHLREEISRRNEHTTVVSHRTSLPGSSLGQREMLPAEYRTLGRATSVLEGIQERISELRTLEEAATKNSVALKDLLTLKQQQAGVVEAREAVKQATETLKQGRSIMLFTVVTIIFLPLSFCATIFGMNATELNAGLLSLHHEIKYMFSISLFIICTSFFLAFSSSSFFHAFSYFTWTAICYPGNVAMTWLFIKIGLFTLSRDFAAKGKALKEHELQKTGTMKANAMRERLDLKQMKEIWKEENGRMEFEPGEYRLGRVTTGDMEAGKSVLQSRVSSRG